MAFWRFCLVGSVGFAIDSAATLALTQAGGLGPMSGRALAFVLAASVTWQLNRRFTFRSQANRSTWLPYIALTSVGAVINMSAYRLWLGMAGTTPIQIIVGIALGSIVALAFNFLVSQRLVFADR